MAQTDNELLTQLGTGMIRMDAKLDNVILTLSRLETNHHDHEIRIRLIEASYATRQQVKEIADKPTVSPATMWKVATLSATVLSLLWGIAAFLVTNLR